MNEPETIRAILKNTKTIAVVGLSDDPSRPSHGVAMYMQKRGYRIIPVNPQIGSTLGETAYGTLDDACQAAKAQGNSIDLVNVFRASAFVPEVVKDAMRLHLPAIWLQEGVCHDEAVGWAEADGIQVVMDRCILKEHAAAAGRAKVQ